MSLVMNAVVVALFVALTPGVLLRLPPGGSKLTVAVVHGLVFAIALHFIYMNFFRPVVIMGVSEGFGTMCPTTTGMCANGKSCTRGAVDACP